MKNPRFIAVFLFVASAFVVRGQIFVTNYNDNTVGKYDITTGSVINTSFITGLTNPQGLAVSGNNLFVANNNIGRIGKYNADTGVAFNSSFIGGLSTVMALTVSDGNLFVSSSSAVKRYDLNSGALLASGGSGISSVWGLTVSSGSLFATIDDKVVKFDAGTLNTTNASFIAGLTQATGVAAIDGVLYVANSGTNTIGKYDAITGATLNSSFITGGALSQPASLSISGGNLFVVNQSSHSLAVYDLATGATVNASFVTGLTQPTGMTVSAIPEPSTYAAMFGLLTLGFAAYRRRPRKLG